jgi:hypothetical protein
MQNSMVLHAAPSGAALVGAVDRALAAAEAHGLRPYRYAYSESDRSGADTHVWFGVSDEDEIKAVEDPRMGAVYLLYQGKDVEALERHLGEALGRRTCDDLLSGLAEQLSDRPDRLMLLSLCDSGRFHAGAAALVEESLQSSDAEIRLAAANAAALAKWAGLTNAVETAMARETDERVARTLDYARSVLDPAN